MSWASDRRIPRRGWLLAGLLACAGCGPQQPASPPRAVAIGEGFVAPETLHLRGEIAFSSGTVATVKRGERVEILARRRRFLKVRTAANVEGWTEQHQLLTPEVYRQIDQQARQAAAQPGLGIYRARDRVNVHLEPYRWSPGIYQLQEAEKVMLLARRLVERTSGPPVRPGPAPAAPPGEAPRQSDDWRLVRSLAPSGIPRAGWVLSRMLDADIPDEVAQYAEGRSITSYFALSEVADGDQIKKNWLWTTVERGLQPHDFDSFRVFNWGRRRHRYETSYIERGVKGFFPLTAAAAVETRYGSGPGFTVVIGKKDGQRYARRYVMVGHIVRLYAEERVPEPAPLPAAPPLPPPAQPAEEGGFKSFLRRLFGKK